jgi:hypothetical protein
MVEPISAAGAVIKAGQSALSGADSEIEQFAAQITGTGRKEVGGWFADHIRLRRFKSQLKILGKAQEYAEKAGFDPEVVNMNVLVPLLEAGSLEEDEAMADRWAALLANASSNKSDAPGVPPSFPEVLRQLAPKDAAVLDAIFDVVIQFSRNEWVHRGAIAQQVQDVFSLDDYSFAVTKQNLIRLGLCAAPASGLDFTDGNHLYPVVNAEIICLTEFGHAFVTACRAPAA